MKKTPLARLNTNEIVQNQDNKEPKEHPLDEIQDSWKPRNLFVVFLDDEREMWIWESNGLVGSWLFEWVLGFLFVLKEALSVFH